MTQRKHHVFGQCQVWPISCPSPSATLAWQSDIQPLCIVQKPEDLLAWWVRYPLRSSRRRERSPQPLGGLCAWDPRGHLAGALRIRSIRPYPNSFGSTKVFLRSLGVHQLPHASSHGRRWRVHSQGRTPPQHHNLRGLDQNLHGGHGPSPLRRNATSSRQLSLRDSSKSEIA